ncbi:GNAT family N-acetyltransferase [Flavitalea sp. BT771]|uniref:GNAT family N-acetyltransferase n=1 Tax=Flavitalea sp. BT771 TaxID=3063329 RepID=UPI0026E28A90|nr:GNAT family N-acetyltransferase [Flavitalea sp. BT771]MDO6435199.1 GNAT family N-acetyltransferase [Flavitalea sp. BT771]MDV6224096.1 GNAT family N-acetyltransferase [Flavitalea sp. BT771]
MTKEPKYKICSEDDIPQILEIYKQSYIEHYTYLWSDKGENYMKTSFTKERILSEMNEAHSKFFLIYEDDLPVGILKINDGRSTDGARDPAYLEVERIYFLKKAAGKGLGKLTLQMVDRLAKNANKTIIWLKAMKGADAVKFYEKQGFEVIDETELSYPFIKDEFKRMVVMQLRIK